MAQQNTNKTRPAHAARPKTDQKPETVQENIKSEDLVRQKMMEMTDQLHVLDDSDDELSEEYTFHPEELTEENKDDDRDEEERSLKLMIEELTQEAVENTKSQEFSIHDELIPQFRVELEDDDDFEEEPSRFPLTILIPAILVILALIAGTVFFLSRDRNEQPVPTPVPTEETETASTEETAEPEPQPADPAEANMNHIKDRVKKIVDGFNGKWSVYLKDLKTEKSFVINDEQMPSASLIKLFTAGKYLEMVENGELYETDDSAYLLMAMISWSDNDAWEILETNIGYGDYTAGLMAVTEFAQRNGYINSGRDIGSDSIYDENADNLTTASEIGRLLESIYNGTFVSETASARLYELLYNQQYTYKIPAGLPEGFEFASKSGELPGVENDAAIIKGPDTEYILVILSNEITDSEEATNLIARLSNFCALLLNPTANGQ